MFAPPVAKAQTKTPTSSAPPSRRTTARGPAPPALTKGEASPDSSWDFSAIPIFPPNRASQTDPPARREARPLPGIIQTKLKVSNVDDPLEREADEAAEQVMRMPDPKIAPTATPPHISRKCEACKEEKGEMQGKAAGTVASELDQAPAIVHEMLRSPGQPLHPTTRAFFEPRLGSDFSRVRVHTDTAAAESA